MFNDISLMKIGKKQDLTPSLFAGLISSKTRISLLVRFFFNPGTKAYLIDDYAEGKDTGIIDLVLVGNIDQYHLNDLSRKTERYIERKIRPLVLTSEEFAAFLPALENRPNFLIWERPGDR